MDKTHLCKLFWILNFAYLRTPYNGGNCEHCDFYSSVHPHCSVHNNHDAKCSMEVNFIKLDNVTAVSFIPNTNEIAQLEINDVIYESDEFIKYYNDINGQFK